MKVGIVGASGYAGVELLRLCAGHPDLDVTVATAGVTWAAWYSLATISVELDRATGEIAEKLALAGELKAGANGSEERMKAKLVTGKFFMERVLPETAAHLKRITSGADTMMELPAEAF